MKHRIFAIFVFGLVASFATADTSGPSIYATTSDNGATRLMRPNEYRGTASSAKMNRCEYFGKFAEDANQRHRNGETGSSILGTVLDFEMDTGGPSKDSYILREVALFATGPNEPSKGYLLTVFLSCIEQDW